MMVLWETEFFALSVITGEVESFRGVYIKADTIVNAMLTVRNMELDYLQLTGNWFTDIEAVGMNEEFYKKLTSPKNIVENMSFDEFADWLDLALGKDDLIAAKREFEKEGGLDEHIKIINIYIEKYDEKNKDEETQ